VSHVAAVDIGASSGRVVVASVERDVPSLTEVARFPNLILESQGEFRWDIHALFDEVMSGVATAVQHKVKSWGIDTWAVDFGLIDSSGALVGDVRAYRDPRHANGIAPVRQRLPWDQHYDITGIQHLPFNTIYQLAVDPSRVTEDLNFLLVPDLLSFLATGVRASDITNASSTAMVDVSARAWSTEILDALALPHQPFLPLDEPGSIRGPSRDPRHRGLPLIGVATHDTASAFIGAPITSRTDSLVISLGTWALIGAESTDARPTETARLLNVTHELGADGTVRLLRNVSGMWLLEECRRHWAQQDGAVPEMSVLIDAALGAPAFAGLFDIDAQALSDPGQSPHTIERHLHRQWDGSRGAVVRSILESLVLRLAQRATEIEGLLGTTRSTINVVGGASRINPLMQWLADATGKRVVAGPAEATALGNAMVQWCALGVMPDIATARAYVATMPEIRYFTPEGDRRVWQSAAERLQEAQHG
jgi:rhamnulokinase